MKKGFEGKLNLKFNFSLPNIKYISYDALSSHVFTEALTLLQEFLKSHAAVCCGGLKSPDRCVGPL